MIYEPNEDSFLIESEIRKRARGKKILDVGCGSGILSEAALESGAKEVLSLDIDDESLNFCKKKGLNVIKSNLFSALKKEEKFDLIVFNPPYLPADEREDKESARATTGGNSGDEIILKFLNNIKEHLAERGEVLILVSSLTPMSRIRKIVKEKKFNWKVVAKKKIFMEELMVLSIFNIQTFS